MSLCISSILDQGGNVADGPGMEPAVYYFLVGCKHSYMFLVVSQGSESQRLTKMLSVESLIRIYHSAVAFWDMGT